MVEGQRCTDDRHAPGQLALDCDTELPTLRGARLEQRVGACCAESLSARCTEQSCGTAVDHGLGGGDDVPTVRSGRDLDLPRHGSPPGRESGGRTPGRRSRAARGLARPACEQALRRREASGSRPGLRRASARRRRPRSPPAVGRSAQSGSVETVARSRSSPGRRGARAPRAARRRVETGARLGRPRRRRQSLRRAPVAAG